MGLAISAFLQMALAQAEVAMLSAAPFVASDSPDTPSMLATTVSTGKRSPYLALTNDAKAPYGTYNGVVITPDTLAFPRFLNSLTFDYKGSDQSAAYIEFKPPRGSWMRTAVSLSEAKTVATSKDGFKTVLLNGTQFGIPDNSIIKKITIAPPARKDAGRFLADAIYVNGSPVRKVMNTLFFKVTDGSPTGPLEFSQQKTVKGVGTSGPPTTATQFAISNITNYSQNVYMNIIPNPAACAISDPTQIPFTTTITWNNPAAGIYYFVLPKKSKVISNLSTTQMLAGAAISFGEPPDTYCPTTAFPQGNTQAEFTINTYCWTGDYSHNETADISDVNGNNAFTTMQFGGTNANLWLALTQSGGIGVTNSIVKRTIKNFCLGDNTNNPGVYPFRCTNCINAPSPPTCPTWPNPTTITCNNSSNTYCQLNRTACFPGGLILVTFKGYDPTTVSSGAPGSATYFAPILTCGSANPPEIKQATNPACP